MKQSLTWASYAYENHVSDYDMLSVVGNPVMVGYDM